MSFSFGSETPRARLGCVYPQGEKVYNNVCVFAGRQYFKDVLLDGQSHLLIIREESELPGAQVSWKT